MYIFTFVNCFEQLLIKLNILVIAFFINHIFLNNQGSFNMLII